MKQIKVAILIAIIAIALVGCANKTQKERAIEEIFKEELKIAYEISHEKGKKILEDISIDTVEEIMKDINAEVVYKEITQGIANDENNIKTACVKLPADIKLMGNEEEIKSFINNIHDMANRVSVGDIDIHKINEKYELDMTMNFFGKMKAENLSIGGSKVSSNVQVVEGKVDEADEVKLRDFNIFMILRPSNSDAASVALEFKNNEKSLMYDNNGEESISMDIIKESGKYFCNVKSNNLNEKVELKNIKEKIVFDILSCDKIQQDDMVGVNLEINNLSNKKVDIIVFEDNDERVNVKTSGNIEVDKK